MEWVIIMMNNQSHNNIYSKADKEREREIDEIFRKTKQRWKKVIKTKFSHHITHFLFEIGYNSFKEEMGENNQQKHKTK